VQSVLVIGSNTTPGSNPTDVFKVLQVVPGTTSMLRSCAELGHK
jgi:hypothetical protein